MLTAARRTSEDGTLVITYRTTIEQFGEDTGIPVPDEVLERLGAGPHPRVTAEVEGHRLTDTIGVIAGRPLLEFSAKQRAASGVERGQQVTVHLELAPAPEVEGAPAAAAAGAPTAPDRGGVSAAVEDRVAAEPHDADAGTETVEVPADLAAALASSPLAGPLFDVLPPQDRERLVAEVTSVEQADARERRVASVVAKLEAGEAR